MNVDNGASVAYGVVIVTANLTVLGYLIRRWIANIDNANVQVVALIHNVTDKVVAIGDRLSRVEVDLRNTRERLGKVEGWQEAHDRAELARAIRAEDP